MVNLNPTVVTNHARIIANNACQNNICTGVSDKALEYYIALAEQGLIPISTLMHELYSHVPNVASIEDSLALTTNRTIKCAIPEITGSEIIAKTQDEYTQCACPVILLHGLASGDNTGISVGNVEDINNDGKKDIIVGNYRADPGNVNAAGTITIIFGENYPGGTIIDAANLITNSEGVSIIGEDEVDRAGNSVASAGDWNKDGFPDAVVGVYLADPDGDTDAGEVFIIFGGNGLTGEIELSTLVANSGGVRIKGIDVGDHTGISVEYIGDWNGDNVDDIAIGAYLADPDGKNDAGVVYIVFGQSGSTGGTIDLATLVANNEGVVIKGVSANAKTGISIGGVVDWNNDGIKDLVIGSHYTNPGFFESGAVYVVWGRPGSNGEIIELSTLVADLKGSIIQSSTAGERAGNSVDSAGDWNGDGIMDIVIGAPSNLIATSGRAYIVFGRDGETGTTISLTTLIADSNGVIIQGINNNEDAGHSVCGIGDWNGDNISDIAVTAPLTDFDGKTDVGAVYIVFGRSIVVGQIIPLSTLTEDKNGVVIKGINANDQTGYSVSTAKDFNGDGINDLVIGTYLADPNGLIDAGTAAVVLGQSHNINDTISLDCAL